MKINDVIVMRNARKAKQHYETVAMDAEPDIAQRMLMHSVS